MEEADDSRKLVRRLWIAAVFLLAVIVGISASAWICQKHETGPQGQIICYANPSSFLMMGGWMRLHEADRQSAARMISERRAEWRFEPSLVCRDEVLRRFVVYEWWWRRRS